MHPRLADTPCRPAAPLTRFLLVLTGLGLVLGMLALTTPAQAAEGGESTVSGTLRNSAEDNAPVVGVEVTATPQDGEAVTATSDADGRFEIKVPVPADGRVPVTIELNTDTLPDGVGLRTEGDSSRTVSLGDGQVQPILFAIGPDTRNVSTWVDQVPQLLWNGILFGLVMAMGALGLSMVFGTTGLTNFAHGELVTFGALITYMGNAVMGLPFVVSVVLAVVLGAAFGWLQDTGLWRPLRRRGTGLIAMMIVSIGLQFFLRNLFQYFTGGRTMNYDDYITPSGRDFMGLFSYTSRDVMIMVVSILVIVIVTLALSRTRLGRATRAVSDNPALASSTGINVDRVVSLVWIVGTALAALSGSFLAFSLGVTFQIGQLVLLLLFAAVTVGGLGSVWGALIGALIIGVLIEISTLVIPTDLKNAGAMVLLIVILLVRPQGLLGRKERIG